MKVDPSAVHVWCARWGLASRDPAREARYAALLTPEERVQWQRFRFEEGKLEYLMTRALVRDVLSRYVPRIAPADWRFVKTEYGRPRVSDVLGVTVPSFNLSNTSGLVVCAVSNDEVGVDVEPATRGDKVLPIRGDVFSDLELAELAALPVSRQAERAIHLWTLKESFIKARSMGLSLPLKQFSMRFAESLGIHIDPSIAIPGENWQFDLRMPTEEHVVAVSADRGSSGRDKVFVFEELTPIDDLASPHHLGLT